MNRVNFVTRRFTKGYFSTKKYNAKQQGIPFDLKYEDLPEIPTHCPALGIVLRTDAGRGKGARGNAPSLDRIDPSKGYVKGNIVVVSRRANTMKSDGTLQDMKNLVSFYETLLGDRE